MGAKLRALLIVCVVGLMPSASARAQVDRAIVSGIVKDSNGGVLPGATVTATNLATDVESRQQTNGTGDYQIVNLIPGRYRVDAELSGFKKRSQVGTLEGGQRARLDIELAIGSFSEVVSVAETTQLLNTTDATVGAVIPQSQ